MDNPSKKRTLWFTIVNAFLFLSTIIVCYITLCFGTVAGQVDTGTVYGWMYIITFTVQSNILLGIIALINLIFGIRNLRLGKPIPRAALVWYLVASSAAMLTALTVIFFLAPMRAINGRNYFDMLLEPMFFLHFFNPVLSAVIYIFFMDGAKLPLKSRLLALIPFVIYAIIYLVFVVILKICPDFYGLTFGGHYYLTPLVFIGFIAVDFGIATMLNTLQCKYLAHLK